MKTAKRITPTELKIINFMADQWSVTAKQIADLLTIENESAGGHFFNLKAKGFVKSRKQITRHKDSHIKSRKVYFLTNAARRFLNNTGSDAESTKRS